MEMSFFGLRVAALAGGWLLWVAAGVGHGN